MEINTETHLELSASAISFLAVNGVNVSIKSAQFIIQDTGVLEAKYTFSSWQVVTKFKAVIFHCKNLNKLWTMVKKQLP